MKVLAFYLPQFHTTTENDRWWGKGFTDWVAVKKAVPLYNGHNQPKVPYGDRYYDLTDVDSLKFQAELLLKYNVDGLCFYHYYFKNGKRLLTKPAEILLEHEEIPMPFCFSWANERWVRNWSNIIGDCNSWNDDTWDSAYIDEIDGVLVEQSYGDIDDWEKHFYYLLPFFRDERYIRIHGHPLMIIYKQRDLYCMDDMKTCWERLADKENMPSVVFISTNQLSEDFSHRVIQEPQNTIFNGTFIDFSEMGPHILDYDTVWQTILVKVMNMEDGVCPGGFVRYDDTPRRGQNGIVIEKNSPEAFKYYIKLLMKLAYLKHSEFIMINAWNEWGEGMYLEPDDAEGFAYLEALRDAKREYYHADIRVVDEFQSKLRTSLGNFEYETVKQNEQEIASTRAQRYINYSETYRRWLKAKMQGKSISSYLLSNGYKNVAIYGMAALGRLLAIELNNSSVNLKYGIDQKGQQFNKEIPVYKPEDNLEAVDLVIMCLGIPDSQLNKKLKKRLGCRVLDMKDLIREI